MQLMTDMANRSKHTPEEICEAEKWYKSANEKHDRTQYRAAVDDFTMAIRILPDEADYYFLRGVSYQFLGKLRSATSDFEKAIALNPLKPGYHLLCANVLVQRNKNKAALGYVETVLALDPAYPGALSLKQEIEANLRV
ncbi:Tetratricopeptide repeat protein [anaerobic digester metagenome]